MITLLVITMPFTATTSAYAATGTRKVTSSGTMSLALNKGQTGNSSEVTFWLPKPMERIQFPLTLPVSAAQFPMV